MTLGITNGAAARPRASRPNHSDPVFPGELASSSDEGLGAPLSEGAPTELLSLAEMVSLAKKQSLDLAEMMLAGELFREQTVRQRDLVRLGCVEEHLVQMKLVNGMAAEAALALRRPENRGDELRLRHEFRRVEMGKEQLREHLQGMEECAGAETPIGEGPNELKGASPVGPGEPDPAAVSVSTPPAERPVAASPIL